MQYADFKNCTGLSEDIFQKLNLYHDLLLKWQKRVNLISPNTINDVWERHILDSLQLLDVIPAKAGIQKKVDSPIVSQKSETRGMTIGDIGSGAGFPGLVLAICGVENITLIESDRKKCEFLKEAARLTNAKVSVCNNRVENIKDQMFDVITSRATAALKLLFEWSLPIIKKDSICLFHKGENWAIELEQAKKTYHFDVEAFPSSSSASGCIIKITNLSKQA